MTTIKAYTNLNQSKKLAKILPIKSADIGWNVFIDGTIRILPINDWDLVKDGSGNVKFYPAWSLAALLEYLRNINSTVYIPMLYVHDNKWMLQFVERGHCNIAEVECNNPIDTCYKMILNLNELNLL